MPSVTEIFFGSLSSLLFKPIKTERISVVGCFASQVTETSERGFALSVWAGCLELNQAHFPATVSTPPKTPQLVSPSSSPFPYFFSDA